MAILVKPYEISIWKDELVTDAESSYYKEKRIAVIGSNTMTSPNKAFSPVLTEKNNGEITFTFSMAYRYFDPASKSEVINPFIGYLINERKVKLYYDNKWYDFIIKNHEEDSESNVWTYSCTDAFVNELSKVGYNIEFSTELGNNQGTAVELAAETLKNTDWEVGENESDTLVQKVKEPMYKYLVSQNFSAKDTSAAEDAPEVTISAGETIYVFYSYIANQITSFVQFMRESDKDNFTYDSNNVIIGTNYRITSDVEYIDNNGLISFKVGNVEGATASPMTDTYGRPQYASNQGFKLVFGQLNVYDPVMNKVVNVYEVGSDENKREIYKFTDSIYTTSDVVTSIITNGSNFDIYSDGGLQGWNNATYSTIRESGFSKLQEIGLTSYPEVAPGTDLVQLGALTEIRDFLEIKFQAACVASNDYSNTFFNSGFMDNAGVIDHVTAGQEFVLRVAAATATEQHGELTPLDIQNNPGRVRAMVALYSEVTEESGSTERIVKKIDPNNIILNFSGSFELDNTIIKDGIFNAPDYTTYTIDNIVQEPSSNCVYTENGENPRVWDSEDHIYIPYDSATKFINYYTSVARAQKPLTNTFLTDPTKKIGIFIYTGNGSNIINKYVYISDIQLTKCLRDKNGQIISIGNIPTSAAISTDSYYLKPSEGKQETDVELYYRLDDLARALGCNSEDIKPVYNKDSEKFLSIEEAQSNCFNILQSICETFECWLKIDVEHNPDGSIKLVNGKPIKKIYLKEYAGKDNFAGFKYGINLNSIQRTLNSDEIVTKLIVGNVQSDYTDEGVITIRNATANPSGEANILNFDYYVNKGLIENEQDYRNDLNAYYAQMKQYNTKINELEQERAALEIAVTNIGAQRNAFTEYISAASDSYMEGLEDFKEATGLSYDAYLDKGTVVTEGYGIYQLAYGYYNNENYKCVCRHVKDTTLDKGWRRLYRLCQWDGSKWAIKWHSGEVGVDGTQPPSSESKWYAAWQAVYPNRTSPDYGKSTLSAGNTYDLTENDSILDIVAQLYTSVAVRNNYSGILTNINEEYKQKQETLNGHPKYNFSVSHVQVSETPYSHETRLVLDDYIDGFNFYVYPHGDEESKVECHTTVSEKSFTITSDTPNKIYDRLKITSVPVGYHLVDYSLGTEIEITNGVKWYKLVPDVEKLGYTDLIKEAQSEKDNCEKEFFSKYGKFIKEGTWNSNDYIDSELYYLDAIQVSQTSAFPKIEYSINVAEVSELEGLENYTFAAGEKTYIEDTEFFGWTAFYVNNETQECTYIQPDDYTPNSNKYSKGQAPAREEVIISEVEWHLDSPEENLITVQNYKTQFEDLFQRISATVQQVEYNEATYAKTASILDKTGTINQNLLVASLNTIAGNMYALTSDGSVKINKEDIVIQNLTKPEKRVKINNEGISFSSDAGVTWHQAITGDGIDIGAVYTGKLNTREIVIGNEDNPSFRWDSYGISAYRNEGENSPYDLSTFVRFDQYGLYGIEDSGNFKASSLEDIKNQAYFGITWDGFFIKNSYTNGYVSISSSNDFQIIQIDDNNNEHERIKIGALEFDEDGQPSKYGINIKDTYDNSVFTTGDDGNITITGTINALGGNFSNLVTVGKNQPNLPYIAIDGTNASMYSSNYQDGAGYGWMINKDGDAVFNNITARGAIKTAVFEYAEIQAVGGIFLFRPSSTIKGARVSGNDLILKVEKPFLFAKVSYTEIYDPDPSANPQELGWYEKTNYGYQETTDTTVQVKQYYNKSEVTNGSWCKVSNYTSDGVATDAGIQNILLTNGLTHVYQVTAINTTTKEVTLSGAAVMVTGQNPVTTLEELKGGALVDMGRKDGSSNYGIGVNSSDNTVNLPRRAISLFETEIDESREPKVTYKYRGILGTLPELPTGSVNASIYNNMVNTQGIYTDNMYLGDANQYLTFYTDSNGDKRLRIRASQIVYEAFDPETHEPTGDWNDINDTAGQPGPPGEDAVTVKIDSSIGENFVFGNRTAILTCYVYKGIENITDSIAEANFVWSMLDKDGNPVSGWVPEKQGTRDGLLKNQIQIDTDDVDMKSVFYCNVTFA